MRFSNASAACCLATLLAVPVFAAPEVSRSTIDSPVSPANLEGAARKIMRLSDGRIFASFDTVHGKESRGALFASDAGSATWTNVSLGKLESGAVQSASDTGPGGTYVAFVDSKSGSGAIALFPDPLGNPGSAKVFRALTPKGVAARDTFISASKGEESTNSVAYAWRDGDSGRIFLGYSADGLSFKPARLAVEDAHLASGPSLGVHNNYILLTYLSRNEALTPRWGDSRAFPVWKESWDGGKTWTETRPVFGTEIDDFPKAEEVVWTQERDRRPVALYAAGGSRQLSNSLMWPQPEIIGRMFITSEQQLVTREGRAPAGGRAVAGVVTFKDLSDGPDAPWQHVIASEYNREVADPHQRENRDFQYSALPGTSVRAVAYRQAAKEERPKKERQGDRLVVAVSVNTGKSFDKTVKFDPRALGLGQEDRLLFTTSTCLLLKGDGEVYLDAAYLDRATGRVRVAQLPLGINLKDLPPSLFNIVGRWP